MMSWTSNTPHGSCREQEASGLRPREVAGRAVTRPVLEELRIHLAADRLRLPAARVEAAARRRVHGRRYVTGQDDALALLLHLRIGDRHGGQQRLAVWVERVLVKVDAVGELDDLSQVHDRDAVADVAHHGEVVRDEQVRELEAVLQLFEQVDDLRLNGDIQSGDRLVGDDEVGLHRQGARDADALTLATVELVRVAVREVRIETDDLQKLLHALGLRAALREVMHLERLADDVADGHARVERRVRILEDHLHPAAHAAHLFAGERGELGAIELHRSRGGLVKLEDRASGRRLAAAGLALPIRVDEPPALLCTPAPRLVIGLRVRYPFQLRLLLAADVAPVLAAGLELAAWRRGDEVRGKALDRHELRFA